ncbi:hypothetical protein VNI00_008753 [Paramarasmius palmivorus]|uniref:Uncharacterized protein n=1 Tax=Paramarasmius palmivorus TaxID=297713 RepID=A0AAW0CVF5_9AGAR
METTWTYMITERYGTPEIINELEKHPIRILRSTEAKMLSKAGQLRGYRTLVAAYTRTSSRPVDMVLSIMDLLGVSLDVSAFDSGDRVKATVALIQALMKRPNANATWLYIAPETDASKELSTLPQMPETSESGRAYIYTRKGREPAFMAIMGTNNQWDSRGAPRGEMTDSGYFVFWGKAALVSENVIGKDTKASTTGVYDDRETWALVIGRFKNLNRNPETWKVQGWSKSEKPEGVFELTLMFVQRHKYELFHRVGMEREIDERKTRDWNWTYRRFMVGGPGRGGRQRFCISASGPIYSVDNFEEADDMATVIS